MGFIKKNRFVIEQLCTCKRLSSEPDNCHISDSLKGAGEGPEGMPVNRQHLKTKV